MRKVVWITLVLLTILLAGCSQNSNERCVYCGNTPSREYSENGKKSFVCDNCSSDCFFCGEKATKKFMNLSGEMTFTCKECYDSILNY